MAYRLRIEHEKCSLITTRTRNSRLWFIKNKRLHEAACSYLAKLQARYEAEVFAFNIVGNHYHLVSRFPNNNRSSFMRDFNSQFVKYVKLYVTEYEGGNLWSRRYSEELLPLDLDIENYFFYTALQAVNDGLARHISDYSGYNSFYDAISGIERKFSLINWGRFNDAKRYNCKINIDDFKEEYTLKFSRLPGYEDLSQKDYSILMRNKLEERQQELLRQRKEQGLGIANKNIFKNSRIGSRPKNTKTSTRYSFRPIVLTSCYRPTFFASQ